MDPNKAGTSTSKSGGRHEYDASRGYEEGKEGLKGKERKKKKGI